MSFKTSLRAGALGEVIFYQGHCGDLKRIDGLKGDFEFLHGDLAGQKLELKTDYYDMNKTPNLFIERYSDRVKQTPGGPWQALSHGCEWFSYFFVTNFTCFLFNTQALVDRLEHLLPTLQPVEVKNTSWVTEGYRVPRHLLKDIYTESRLEVRKADG